jgi:hypothetical protein
MSDIPIPQNDQDGGLKSPPFFIVQDDGAGLSCRGLEKKSDVRPAGLPANASFLPTKRGNLGQFSAWRQPPGSGIGPFILPPPRPVLASRH